MLVPTQLRADGKDRPRSACLVKMAWVKISISHPPKDEGGKRGQESLDSFALGSMSDC